MINTINSNTFDSNIETFSEVFVTHINTHYNNAPNNTVEVYDQEILDQLKTLTESEVKEIAKKKAEAYIYFWAIHEEIRKIYTLSTNDEQRLIELWEDRDNLQSIHQVRNSSISSQQNQIRKEKLKNKTRLVWILENKIQEFNSLLQRTIVSEEHQKLLDDIFNETSGIHLLSKGLRNFLESFNNPEGIDRTIESTLNRAGVLLNEDIKTSSGWFDISTPYGELVQPLEIQ